MVSGRPGAVTGPLSASRPGFDPSDVVRRVRADRGEPSATGRALLPDSGEFLIDTSITPTPATGDQQYPAVAFDGMNFLVVWQDDRGNSGWDIYGARVTRQGMALDSAAFVIARTPRNQCYPAVSFDGANFLVVWQDDRDNSGWDIYGARVTPQGAVLDSTGLVITRAPGDQAHLTVGFDGADLLVVWADSRSADICGARVTQQGTVLDTAGFVISHADKGRDYPAVDFDGTNFLVVWEDSRNGSWEDADIYGARVTPQGTVLDTAGIGIAQASDRQNQVAVAFDGTDFLVVWYDHRSGSDWDIWGTRVTPQGMVLDTGGIVISQAAGDQSTPAVRFDGADFLVAWQDVRSGSEWDIYGARVTPQGTVLDTEGIAISQASGDQLSTAVGFDGANFLVVWQDDRDSNGWDIYGARVSPQGAVLDSAGILMSLAANEQSYPAVASDGTNFLVVWADSRNSAWLDIYGVRVSQSGIVLDSAGFLISQVAKEPIRPVVGFDGANYLVVWMDDSGPYGEPYRICGARVSPQGAVLDTTGIFISRRYMSRCCIALASDGKNSLVVWEDDTSSGYYGYTVYGTRVTQEGAVLDSPCIRIARSYGKDDLYAAVGFDGTNFLVVWERCPFTGNAGIYATRVTPQGVVLDPEGIAISLAARDQANPVIGLDGANYLVTWEDYRYNGAEPDVFGARVTPQGTVLDTAGIGIALIPYSQQHLAMGFDGANFLVAWQDSRSHSDWDIYGARVTPEGTVFDCGSVVAAEGNQMWPSICGGIDGRMFLVYQGWTGTVGDRGYNSYRIWGKMDPNPGIEESPKPQASSCKLAGHQRAEGDGPQTRRE